MSYFRVGHPLYALSLNVLFNEVWRSLPATPATPVYRAHMFHLDGHALAGNDIIALVAVANAFEHIAEQNPAAQNDEFSHGFMLSAGTYTFEVLSIRESLSGIVDWTIDGNAIGSTDLYSMSTQSNYVSSIGSVVISTDGWHVLKGKVATKNASSGGYKAKLITYWLRPGSD